MADWITISGTAKGYYGYMTSSKDGDGRIKVYLQYDKETITPTSMKVRFKIDNTVDDYYNVDEYFIYWRPDVQNEEDFFRVKTYNKNWPDYSSTTVTLTKKYNESSFTVPEYWICHTGALCNGKTAFTSSNGFIYMTYGDYSTKRVNWYFEHARQNFVTKVSTFTVSGIANSVATDVGTGTVEIIDNYDNTFTLKGTKGANGTLNTASGPTLSWGYTSSYGTTFTNNQKISLTMSDTSKATRTVYARSVTGATYGNSKTKATSLGIKQYVAPSLPGKPELSYTKSRLTIKEPWTFKWTAATKANDSSPVKGYRIRIIKNGSYITGVKQGSVPNIVYDAKVTDDHVDRDGTSRIVKINPTDFGFKPGDTVQLGIYAYTRKGKNNDGSNSKLFSEKQVYSTKETVRNAGIVRVKVDGKWTEGQVYVKVNGKWEEAESVQTKVKGSWKESE